MDPNVSGEPAPPPTDDDDAPGLIARGRRQYDDMRANVDWYRGEAERRYPPLSFGFDLWDRYVRTNAPALAGHLAFRTFSWILPLALVLVAAASIATSSGVDVADQADKNLGLGATLASSIEQAGEQTSTSRYQLAFVALSGLLLGTSGLLSALHLTFRTLWEIPDQRIRSRGKLITRILGGAPLLLLLLLASSALRKAGLLGGLAGTALSLGVTFVTLLGLSWILPRRTTALRDLLPGPVVGAALFGGLHLFTTFYLVNKLSKMSDAYGAMGITLVFLLYLYLVGQILVLTALVNAVAFDRSRHGAAPDGPAAGAEG